MSFVFGVEPTRDHLDGLAVTGGEKSQQRETQKRGTKDQTTTKIG
jgi:hypothetical protein